jgi:hypothetical protein
MRSICGGAMFVAQRIDCAWTREVLASLEIEPNLPSLPSLPAEILRVDRRRSAQETKRSKRQRVGKA